MKESSHLTRRLQVFLCHSSEDKESVRQLSARLTRPSFHLWLDEVDLLPGQYWRREIPRAVRLSDVVLICLSSNSVSKRGYVQKEIKFALDAADEQPEGTIFIIPVKLEECSVPDRLSDWQWVSLLDPKGFDKLVRSLQSRAYELGIAVDGQTDTRASLPGVSGRNEQSRLTINSGATLDLQPVKRTRSNWLPSKGRIAALMVLALSLITIVWVIAKTRDNSGLTNSSRTHYKLGVSLANQRSFTEAENEFREALKTDPNSPLIRTALGQALGNQRKLTEAESEFKQAIRIDPNYSIAYDGLGMTLNDELHRPEAEDAFKNAIRINPNYAEAHFNLGFTLFYVGRYPEAEEQFRQAIKYEPTPAPPDPYNGLGLVLDRQGKYPEAVAAFRDALAHNRDFAPAHNGLGVALTHQINIAEAVPEFREAIRLNPYLAEAYYNLGVTLLAQGQDMAAEENLRKAASRDPNYPNNEKFHLYLGLSLAGQNKFAEATDEFGVAIALNRTDPIPHNARLLVLIAQNRKLEYDQESNELKQLAPNFVAATDFKQLRSRPEL